MWILLLSLGGIAVLLLAYSAQAVNHASEGRMFDSMASVPTRRVGIVPGCVRILPNGRENLYFRYRIQAAADLFAAGKVRHLLVSGDNHRHGINEPEDMKAALVEKGVPADRIVCDFAGFRTLDTVVRAQRVFHLTEALIITQDWHARRAIYLARGHDLDLIGYATRDVTRHYGLRTRLRENLARVKAVLDLRLLGTKPRFLGNEPPIGNP